ncbi:hypothetical protein BpHYR1_049101 [Brachionus plicatilis]|uniref:Uncharacterized protein n=1 Tax=Brachionus plicatilis TaxID=10195 RepID=A0A3M7PVW2_BRAPC|nr:hypothetical protein BpHYR1_049101 [Brachionus plicatilis]
MLYVDLFILLKNIIKIYLKIPIKQLIILKQELIFQKNLLIFALLTSVRFYSFFKCLANLFTSGCDPTSFERDLCQASKLLFDLDSNSLEDILVQHVNNSHLLDRPSQCNSFQNNCPIFIHIRANSDDVSDSRK